MAERDTGQRAADEIAFARRVAAQNSSVVGEADTVIVAVLLARILDEQIRIRQAVDELNENVLELRSRGS